MAVGARLALVCLVAYAWVVHGWRNWNPESHLALTYAIVDSHTFAIDPYVDGLGDRAMASDHYYTDKLPVESFLAVPVYALLRTVVPPVTPGATDDAEPTFVRYVLTLLIVSVPAALGVALLWQELVRTGATRNAATLAALAYGLGSLVWPFATLYFSHALTATCVLATWVWARRGQSRALAPAALALMCEAPAALAVVPALALGGLFWWREHRVVRRRSFAFSILLALVPIVLTGWYATVVYGAPWRLGYEHLAGPQVFRVGMSTGVMGIGLPHLETLKAMLIEPFRGLLIANPVLLIAVPAGVLAARRRLVWEGSMLLTFCAFLVVLSGYAFWDGGASIGPRHVISALPLVFLASGRVFRGAVAHLVTFVSILLMLLAVAAGSIFADTLANPWTQAIFPAALGQAPLDLTWPTLLLDVNSLWGFVPVAVLIVLMWPVPFGRRSALYVPLPVTGDNTEAENQHYATTWWKRSDCRGDRAWRADVLCRLAIRRPGNTDPAS